ncbi:polyisoprenoid-binding protein YceI [Actinoplanes tereljensis]|uniref:Polyisoprenoid-binding protein n=1 Tax=Paractinoplanes tereljensis TaxID=571912 RepID=A0A919TU05_9ACTN|nr:YceI family protein [Actinoplanes tereljensis]GIF23103.1 polyisoprenoid-binding protein [Actinoplanes tereljensis]
MVDRPIRDWNGLTIPDPGIYVLDQAHKRIGFHAQHMMVSPVRGEFAQGSATIAIAEDPLRSTVTATIAAASLTTHHQDRDTHLSSPDFLDAARYPTLEFRSTGVRWQESNDAIALLARLRSNPLSRRGRPDAVLPAAARPSGKFLVYGNLTIRNVTRPIELQVEYGGARRDPYGQDIFGFSATAEFDREAYGLVWNVFLESGGLLVGKTVRLEIAGEAIHQAA